MHVLDHIENIQLPDDFPIKNLHALNYHADGLYYLARTVREEEIKKFRLENGVVAYQAIGMDNHSILMNMFNWFSISIINYIRLVGFIDYIVKNKLTEADIENSSTKSKIKEHSSAYVKKIIPDIVQYRNKLSAHHSLFDPWNEDNISTLVSSSMNTIVYRNPFFEASFFMNVGGNEPALKPWTLTKLYTDLCARYWPAIQLPEIPIDTKITDVYKGLQAEQDHRDAHALIHYTKTIDENINSKDLSVQEQVAIALIQKAVILGNGRKEEEAIVEYQRLVALYGDNQNLKISQQVAKAIYNQAQIYSKLGMYRESITATDTYFSRYNDSKDFEILTGLGDLMIAKGVRLEKVGNTQEALTNYDHTIDFFQQFPEHELLIYEAQAMVNKAVLLKEIGKIQEAIDMSSFLIEKYQKSPSSHIQDQIAKVKFISI